MIDYTNRDAVMNSPESGAEGSEVRDRNTSQRHGTGAVPQGMEVQATQLSAAPTECGCPAQTCQPEKNIGRFCWRSGFSIFASDFPDGITADSISASQK